MVTRKEKAIKLNMENITDDQFQKYKKVLSLDDIETIDSLINKYSDALSKYYLQMNNNVYDLQELFFIVDAFIFFSDMKNVSLETMSKFYSKGMELISKNILKKSSQFENLFCLYFNIVSKFINQYSFNEAQQFLLEFEVFEKMKCTLAFIYQHEECSKIIFEDNDIIEIDKYSNMKLTKRK